MKFWIFEKPKNPKVHPNAFVLTQNRLFFEFWENVFFANLGDKLKNRGLLPVRKVLVTTFRSMCDLVYDDARRDV